MRRWPNAGLLLGRRRSIKPTLGDRLVFSGMRRPGPNLSEVAAAPSSSIQLSATGRLLDITYMCYVFRTPLFPAQLLLARQFDLSVTSIPQSVSRWRHNEYSWCSHPLHFVQAWHTPVVKVRLVVWRSDLTGQGAAAHACWNVDFTARWYVYMYLSTTLLIQLVWWRWANITLTLVQRIVLSFSYPMSS